MPPIITYSLRLDAPNSDEFYRTIARFAADWTAKATHAMGDVVTRFREQRREAGLPDRSEAECALELLALGVLLKEHGSEAVRSPAWLGRALEWLLKAQARWPRAEAPIKAARGVVGWLARPRANRSRPNGDVPRLIAWLRANDRASLSDRLTEWQAYFGRLGPHPARRVISRSLDLAANFAVDSSLALGQYTKGVEQFLSETARQHRWRYDAEFVSRSRLEYHLGLLATEILNRAYRERFLSAGRKVAIVPPCMRAQPEEKCKAIQTPLGAQCQACTPTCRVHQITQLGKKHGFEVYIIPDEFRGIGAEASHVLEGLGVVGVSCALTNWSGGWELQALGVPAQGVLLDYVGCNYHWDEKGIPTDTNLERLTEVLGVATTVRDR